VSDGARLAASVERRAVQYINSGRDAISVYSLSNGRDYRVMSSGRFSAQPRRPPRPLPAIIVEALTAEDAEDAEVAQGEVNNYETT